MTVSTYKAAVIDMYDPEAQLAFQGQDFRIFLAALRRKEIKHTKELQVDLTPVTNFFKAAGPNERLSMLNLTQKLCWLLGVCGFMRPDDIRCIDTSNPRFSLQDVVAILPVLLPKETREGSRICKYPTVKSHSDPMLCPV
ncbi:hypothetical protein BGZ73_002422, partial [Actinomortierella ambigua]